MLVGILSLTFLVLISAALGARAWRAGRQAPRGRRIRRGESGQGLVEMAILLPLLLVLVVGVVEVASGINTYITVVNSARDGARLASKGVANDDAIRTLIVNETDRLRDPVDPNADVTIDRTTVDGVDAVKVTVCNDHSLLLGVPLVMADQFRMCSTTAMRVFEQ
jgi:Flp pilus assembly protein TadG